MKPKIPNQKKKHNAHHQRVERYASLLDQVYLTLNNEVARSIERSDYVGDVPFSFKDYPETKAVIDKIQRTFANDLNAIIINGTTAEWGESNFTQDELAKKVLSTYGAVYSETPYKRYFSNNNDALQAFQQRKDKGLNISQKVWNLSKEYKIGLEAAISMGTESGISAIQLSKQISKYLKDYPTLRKDYTEKFGKATKISDCEYRSARLARTEINMAYRKAEQTRWSQMDFVVGYEVKRSGRDIECSVCASLVGKYPKDFEFLGWHPNCFCYCIPVLKTEDEFWDWDGRGEASTNSINKVNDVPKGFKDWVRDNKERIAEARKNNTLPYFLKNNNDIILSLPLN